MIRHMIAFAPSTPKLGEFNQLRGVLSGLMHFCCGDVHFAYNLDMCFENVAGGPLKRHLYADDEAFERDVFRCLDDYFPVICWCRRFLSPFVRRKTPAMPPPMSTPSAGRLRTTMPRTTWAG